MIAHQNEGAVRRNKGEDLLVLPPFQSDTGVEGDVVQKPGVDEGHAEIRHSRKVNIAVYLTGTGINFLWHEI